MYLKLKRFAGQLLFAANVFVVFLLFFEDRLVVPVWLQTVGRMHPLLLHFPIVILLIAMLLEFFRFKPENTSNTFYKSFLENMLLAGSLFAAATVVMGLFLSKEEGYGGDTLLWHKWTGAGIFFLASIIYLIRDQSWYKSTLAKMSALAVVTGSTLTGHYGAELTHGDNFIFEPVLANRKKQSVNPDEALVYNDVIKPILEQKCTSCHNPEKVKGELILSDPEYIKRGGKSGKLFASDQTGLFFQRIHLPETDKKHMPPKGKSQLTAHELVLLSLWVKQQPDFNQKLTQLKETDSLRVLAAALLQPASASSDQYNFVAADADVIKGLNNDYRTITPVAVNSPALLVNIYNRSAFSPSQLDELEKVREQIVALNLNKMPVKDEHLKTIGKFVNLRRLDLNFTDITASGLKNLAQLQHLRNISIAGTKVGAKDLESVLPGLKALKSLTVWNTTLSAGDISTLKKKYPGVIFEDGFRDTGENPLKLNPPQIKNESVIFAGVLPLQLKHPIKGVELRYTLDGSEPDSVKSAIFKEGVSLTESAPVKVRAFKQGWHGSDVSTFDFFKSRYKPDSVRLLFPLNRVHQAEGANTFFDHKLGVIGANNPAWANNWGGVRDNDLGLYAQFDSLVSVSNVGLHYMIEEDTGIFPPEVIEIWGETTPDNMKLLSKFKAGMPAKGDKPVLKTVQTTFKAEKITCMKIVARPLNTIPDWHRNKGKKALLLVDEIFVN